jgi:hypothetical protein
VRGVCGDDPDVLALMARKPLSTGVLALSLGVADERYDRYIVSGFSFEITPITLRIPWSPSAAAPPAVRTLTSRCCAALLARHQHIFTTEPVVHERAGVPRLPCMPERAGGVVDDAA